MIRRTHRFHGLNSHRFVHRTGQTVRGPLCVLKYSKNTRRSTYRAAVVVSRKVSKSAVVRNRIRRRVYEAIRSQGGQFAAAYDVVFIIYSDQFATMPAAELQKNIIGKLQTAGVLSNSSGHSAQSGV